MKSQTENKSFYSLIELNFCFWPVVAFSFFCAFLFYFILLFFLVVSFQVASYLQTKKVEGSSARIISFTKSHCGEYLHKHLHYCIYIAWHGRIYSTLENGILLLCRFLLATVFTLNPPQKGTRQIKKERRDVKEGRRKRRVKLCIN